MAQFFQSNANGADVLGIEEQSAKFSLSSTGNNLAHDLAKTWMGPLLGGATSAFVGAVSGRELRNK